MQRGRGVRECGRTKAASPDPGGCGGILCAEEAAVSGTGLVAQGTIPQEQILQVQWKQRPHWPSALL